MQIFISVVIMDRDNWFEEYNLGFGYKGKNLAISIFYCVMTIYIFVSFHLLIRRYKYYSWYPALLSLIGHYIFFVIQHIPEKKIETVQENDPDAKIDENT